MDALYQLRARVGMLRLSAGPLVGLVILDSQRIQQREYVRVPLSTDAWGFYDGHADPAALPADAPARLATPFGLPADDQDAQPFRLHVQDLSAGGLRGRTQQILMPGDDLTIDLPLPAAEPEAPTPVLVRGRVVALSDLPEPLNLRARVVRRVETGLPNDLACEIGVAFVDVSKAARERIIRFALSVQRDRRRRGML